MGILTRHLIKSFGQPPVRILKGIDLQIDDGDFVSIVGRSGSGKSTLIYILSTLDVPTGGLLEIDGRDVMSLGVKELHDFRNRHLGFVFQFHYLLPELTALENILMPAMKMGLHRQRQNYARELMEQVGILDKVNHFPSQLSGGEQQRVAIARALIMQPRYIFADEPTGNLDSVSGTAVMELLKKINQQRGTTIVYVTHDQEFAAMAKRTIRLADGLLVS